MDCHVVSHVDYEILRTNGFLFLPMCLLSTEKRLGDKLFIRGPDPHSRVLEVEIVVFERPNPDDHAAHMSVRVIAQ